MDTTKCAKYLFNDPLNINLKPPSSTFPLKDYGTTQTLPKNTLPKYSKEIQSGVITRKEGKLPEDFHLTSFQKEYYSELQQGHLYNIRHLDWGNIVFIELLYSKQPPSAFVLILTHEGYILTLPLLPGLPYLPMCTYYY